MRPTSLSLAAALAALVLAPPSAVEAQRTRDRRSHGTSSVQSSTSHTRAFLTVGWRQIDVDELNASLAAAGYPEVADDFISVGGGVQLIAGRVMIGVEGFGLIGTEAEVSRGEFDATLAGGHGAVSIGLAAIATPHFRLYPMASLGGGAMTLDIIEAGRVSFDEVLVEPRRGSHLSQASLLAGAGLGADLMVPFGAGGRLLTIGLAGGYTFAPWTSRWYLSRDNSGSASVTDGPDLGIEGPYAKLTLGFGWRR